MKRQMKTAKTARPSKADEIMKTYHELGFVPSDESHGVQISGSSPTFAPLSFLPHIDYTVSSFVGGI